MSEPAFTPGPWRFHGIEENTIVAGVPGLSVADCNARSRSAREKNANAHLIKASPNLYAALDALVTAAAAHIAANGLSAVGRDGRARECKGRIMTRALEAFGLLFAFALLYFVAVAS